MAAELVTTGYRVEILKEGKAQSVGRQFQVRAAAEALCDLLRKSGQEARVASVMKFERDNKRIR